MSGDYRTAAGLGDVDGDRASDVLIGPRGCDGPVQIFAGTGSGLGGSPIYTFPTTGTPLCPLHLLAR